MTKFKKVLFVFIGLYMFAALSLAYAQGGPDTDRDVPKRHFGQQIQKVFDQLNLTDDQKKSLESNKQEHRAKMERNHQEMKANQEALRAELMLPGLNMPKINEIHNKIKALQSQMEDDKLSSILVVRAILTPEQFVKFGALMRKHIPRPAL